LVDVHPAPRLDHTTRGSASLRAIGLQWLILPRHRRRGGWRRHCIWGRIGHGGRQGASDDHPGDGCAAAAIAAGL